MKSYDKICLVLGANGFIGSHLVDSLASDEHLKVRAFDRYFTDPQFKPAANVEIIKGDIYSDKDIKTALKGVDYVLHSFSATTPAVSDEDPYIDITHNLLRSVQIFDLSVQAGVKKIGYLSSGGAVYGSVAEEKAATETDASLPVSPYGINKLGVEYYLEYFKRKKGIDYVVYRLTNPYGPRQVMKMNQGVIPMFLGKIHKGEEIVIHGDGSSSRDYIYIEDAARMIAESFMSDNKYPVYNVGSGVQTSLNEIVEALRSVTGKLIKVTHTEAPVTYLQKAMVSVDRFNEEFKMNSQTALEEGLRRTLDYE